MTPSPASRFGGFATGHFVVTTICALLLLALLCLSVDTATPLTIVWTMALYIPAGWLVSTLWSWERPTPKEGLKAVLYPALVAWGWALVGWLLTLAGEFFPSACMVGLQLLLSTAFLATPSFVLMLFSLPNGLTLSQMALSPSWYGCIFLAGLLPPLLFFLGSLLPHRVKEDFHEKTNGNNCSGNSSPDVPGGSAGMEQV